MNPAEADEVVRQFPGCDRGYWGRRLACVVVDLTVAPADLVADLLADAWTEKAPPTLARQSPD